MRLIRFTLLGLVCALVLAFPASADCKRCSGRYCESVDDLALGHDHCDISSSMQTSVGFPSGITISWVTTCTPAGDLCTNDHTSITVSGGGGGGRAGDFGSIQTLNQLVCYMGWGSYFDCG
jgi:hypothetical protein